jgi:hypothetical protein
MVRNAAFEVTLAAGWLRLGEVDALLDEVGLVVQSEI